MPPKKKERNDPAYLREQGKREAQGKKIKKVTFSLIHLIPTPDSEFTHPKHISAVNWTVMHITNYSKEVVVGYIDEDVFHIVFLDKDHKFWPTSRQ